MANINFVNKQDLLKILTEEEAEELIQLIIEKTGRLTKEEFLEQTTLSKTKATGITKQFLFCQTPSSEVKVEPTEQTEHYEEVKQSTPTQEARKAADEGGNQEKESIDPVLEGIFQNMRDNLVHYFNNRLKDVENTCTSNHKSQKEQMSKQYFKIDEMEQQLNKVDSKVRSLEESSSEFLQAAGNQQLVAMKIRAAECTQALETLQLGIKTDVNIFRKEKKDVEATVQKITSHLAEKSEVGQLQTDVIKINQRSKDLAMRLEEIERKSGDELLDYIDSAHTIHRMEEMSNDVQRLSQGQTEVKMEMNNIQKSLKDMQENRQVHASVSERETIPQARVTDRRERFIEPNRRGERTSELQFIKQTPKLPSYDGSTKWKTFVTTFDLYSRANSWDESTKFNAIQLCLRNKAVDYLRSQQSLGK